MVQNAVAWAEESKPEKEKPFPPRAWGEQVQQEHSRPSSWGDRGGRAASACTMGSSGQGPDPVLSSWTRFQQKGRPNTDLWAGRL